jgi:hypothetical protein
MFAHGQQVYDIFPVAARYEDLLNKNTCGGLILDLDICPNIRQWLVTLAAVRAA